MADPIDGVLNSSPAVASGGIPQLNRLKEIFTRDRYSILPVIDARGTLTDILVWADAFGEAKPRASISLDIPAVIMAGGKGTRLAPFTKILPKPLIPINEKPVIEHIVDRLNMAGVDRFFVTVGYISRILKAFFEELSPNYQVEFFEESKPLGTIGGLRLIQNKIDSPVLVTNCDVIANIDYADFFDFHVTRNNALTVMASAKNYALPYGVCELDKNGDLEKIKEKPELNVLVNIGVYMLSPEVIDLIPSYARYDVTDLIDQVQSTQMKVGVYPVADGNWFDVGQWKDYNSTVEVFQRIEDAQLELDANIDNGKL